MRLSVHSKRPHLSGCVPTGKALSFFEDLSYRRCCGLVLTCFVIGKSHNSVCISSSEALTSLTSSLQTLIEINSFDQLVTKTYPRLRRFNRWLFLNEWGGTVLNNEEEDNMCSGASRLKTRCSIRPIYLTLIAFILGGESSDIRAADDKARAP